MKKIIIICTIISFVIQPNSFSSDYLAPAGISSIKALVLIKDAGSFCFMQKNNRELFEELCDQYTPAVMEMTEAVADHSKKYLPERKLNFFYPANKKDSSVLLVAFELIERGVIDAASFHYVYRVWFDEMKNAVIKDIEKINDFIEHIHIDDKQDSISFTYKGKPVEITFYKGDPAEVIDILPDDLNLFYLDSYGQTFSRKAVWNEFVKHCSRPVVVFTHIYDEDILMFTSEWHRITKNKFSSLKDYTGAVFGLDGIIDAETLGIVWEAFRKLEIFKKYVLMPSDAFDRHITQKALGVLDGYSQDNREDEHIQHLRSFFQEEDYPLFELVGKEILLLVRTISPNLDMYMSIHNTANICRRYGVDLSKSYSERVKDINEKIKSEPSIEMALQLIEEFLNAGVEVDPSFLLDMCGKLSGKQFINIREILKKVPNEGYIDKLLQEAINKLKKSDNPILHKYCTILWISFAGMEKTRDIFAKKANAEARDNAFKANIRYIYELISLADEPIEELLDILTRIGIIIGVVDVDRVLRFIKTPKSEPEILSYLHNELKMPELVKRVFLPILIAVDGLSQGAIIPHTDARATLLDEIFDTYKRSEKKISFRSMRKHRSDPRVAKFKLELEKLFKDDLEAEKVIRSMVKRPRHLFVPKYAEWWAYVDTAFHIGRGQTISQPRTVISMTKELKLRPGANVLEIGGGSGWVASLMGDMVFVISKWREGRVYTIEIDTMLAQFTKENIRRLPYSWNVRVYGGMDGGLGLPEKAPFDAIIVSCGVPDDKAREFIDNIKPQLKIGGRMIMPVTVPGEPEGGIFLVEKMKDGNIQVTDLELGIAFVPLLGKYGHTFSRNPSSRAILESN